MTGRLLNATFTDPYMNVAAEEALFSLLGSPTLRIWENQRSVVIGRAQLASMETDTEYCLERRIPVVRRFTAGGAVFNGPGNVNWSFFIPRDSDSPQLPYSPDPGKVFELFGKRVTQALADCSVGASFRPPNSIVTPAGKVSGMAAYVSKSALLCHGTMLLSADLEEVQRTTRPSRAEVEKKYPRSNFVRVANTGVTSSRFFASLARVSGFHFPAQVTSQEENRLTAELVQSKYSKEEWNLGDPFALDYL